MRKQIVAGNWKMNTLLEDGLKLAGQVVEQVRTGGSGQAEVILAPPFTHLAGIVNVTAGSAIKVAAQNCAAETSGAYTGEVSAAMIRSVGASHVIIGHSERRSLFGEQDEVLYRKVQQALQHELIPIFCCGEVLEEREAGRHREVVSRQLEQTVFKLDAKDFRKIILAYEPVWAIGTGKNASPEQAQEMHAAIRELITARYGKETAGQSPILYGGSCKPSNAPELFAQPDVDGGLIGGASLKAEDFLGIVRAF